MLRRSQLRTQHSDWALSTASHLAAISTLHIALPMPWLAARDQLCLFLSSTGDQLTGQRLLAAPFLHLL